MSVKFKKSIKVAPGVKLNIGKKSLGISTGNKFGGISFNSRTGTHARVSAPGTGLSYGTKLNNTASDSINTDASKKSGSCLVSCLKGFACLLIFSTLFNACFSSDSSNSAESNTEYLSTEQKKLENNSELYTSTPETELPTESSNISENMDLESNTSIPETELPTENSAVSERMDSENNTSTPETELPVENSTTSEIPEVEAIDDSIPDESSTSETTPVVTEPKSEDVLVWIDDTAKRYHKKNGCGMDNAYQVTLDEAIAMGKTPCGRCYR